MTYSVPLVTYSISRKCQGARNGKGLDRGFVLGRRILGGPRKLFAAAAPRNQLAAHEPGQCRRPQRNGQILPLHRLQPPRRVPIRMRGTDSRARPSRGGPLDRKDVREGKRVSIRV